MDNHPPTLEPGWIESLEFLDQTPDKVAKSIEGLSDAELRRRGSDGRFSALENVCHLRDLEIEGYSLRIDRILNETNPLLSDFDGARVAVERNYHEQVPEAALEAFRSSRRRNVEKLRSLTSQQLQRMGTLEGVGSVTLERLAEMMREHDEGHIEDMRLLCRQLAAARE
jgi:hypothetical protein